MAVICSKQLKVPVLSNLLSDYAEGDIVLIPENGVDTEFYVAKHDYEPVLNGTGRTLLVRKDCYDQRVWHTSSKNAYASSNIDSWLNSTYKELLDTDIQTNIGTTTFYYTTGNGSSTVATLSRSVFLLSLTELGKTPYSGVMEEGSALPIASTLLIPKYNGATYGQWTRSPFVASGNDAYTMMIMSNGNATSTSSSSSCCSRPCFTLPSTIKFHPDTNVFIK